MSTLAQVKALARFLGATVERDQRTYQLIAPAGKVWACDGIHTLAMHWPEPGEPREWGASAAKDALERMGHGVTDCTAEDCDTCDP